MSVQIHINGENAGEAIRELTALSSFLIPSTATSPVAPAPQAPVQQPVQALPVQSQPNYQQSSQDYQQPVSTPGQQPYGQQPPVQQHYAPPVVPPAQPAPQTGAVPVTTQSYSQEQIAVAATALCESGQQEQVIQLLAQFGGPPLTAVPKEHYGALATALRGLGAKI